MGLFKRLVDDNKSVWDAYIHHDFIKLLENGTLEKEKFLAYLKQDYIYLLNFAKCYARLALNARNSKEFDFAIKFASYIVQGEMELHKSILKLGINANELSVKDESLVNLAYTRYMLSIGDGGDYVEMLAALSSCTIGYAVIGKEIIERLGGKVLENHPYKEWILTYSSEVFQKSADEFIKFFDSFESEITEIKFKRLSEIFYTVTRCECEFWAQVF